MTLVYIHKNSNSILFFLPDAYYSCWHEFMVSSVDGELAEARTKRKKERIYPE